MSNPICSSQILHLTSSRSFQSHDTLHNFKSQHMSMQFVCQCEIEARLLQLSSDHRNPGLFFFNLLECMMLDFAFSYCNLLICSPITSCLLSYICSVFMFYVHLCLFPFPPTLCKCLLELHGLKWRQLYLMFVHSVWASSMQQSHYNTRAADGHCALWSLSKHNYYSTYDY